FGSLVYVVSSLYFWCALCVCLSVCFFFQAEDGIRDRNVTGVQTCALPICSCRSTRSEGKRPRLVVGDSDGAAVPFGSFLALDVQIGRASCRERGESAGGAGAGKRKREERWGERRCERTQKTVESW